MELCKTTDHVLNLNILVTIGIVASQLVKDIKAYFTLGPHLGGTSVAFPTTATGQSTGLLLSLREMGAALIPIQYRRENT